MSFTQKPSTDKLTAKHNRRNVHVFDSTNMEIFFHRPSPDESKVLSEMRVLEIMEDLKKRTAEELENWSRGQDVAYTPLPRSRILKSNDPAHNEGLHGGHLVSSPISLTSPLAESNLISVSRSHAKTASRANQGTPNTQPTKQTKGNAQCSAEKKDPFALPDKPSFQSFVKRVARIPLPPISAKDFAPVPVTLLAFQKPVSQWPEIDLADKYDDDKICVRIRRSNTPPPPPKFATQRNPYQPKKPSLEKLVTSDTDMLVRKPQTRSNPVPVFLIKRKPLPKDGPLFTPKNAAIKRLPTFGNIFFDELVDASNTNKSRSRNELEIDRAEHV